MNLDLWKEKTKGLFHIVEWTKFWNYIDNLKEENEAYENMRKEAIEYIHNKLFYIQEETIVPTSTTAKIEIERHIYSKKKDLLNILNKVGGSDE